MGELIIIACCLVPVFAFYFIRGLWRNYKFKKVYRELEEYVDNSHVLTLLRERGTDTERLHAIAIVPYALEFNSVECDTFLRNNIFPKDDE